MEGKEILVKGKVQGVFFRASAKEQADLLGIKGWVRNQPDGSVLIHAEGTRQQLEILINWCYLGPPRARVDEVIVFEITCDYCRDFSIDR